MKSNTILLIGLLSISLIAITMGIITFRSPEGMSKEEQISAISSFGKWLKECQVYDMDTDSQSKFSSCNTVRSYIMLKKR